MFWVVVLVVVFGVVCEVWIYRDGLAVVFEHALFPFGEFEGEAHVEGGVE